MLGTAIIQVYIIYVVVTFRGALFFDSEQQIQKYNIKGLGST